MGFNPFKWRMPYLSIEMGFNPSTKKQTTIIIVFLCLLCSCCFNPSTKKQTTIFINRDGFQPIYYKKKQTTIIINRDGFQPIYKKNKQQLGFSQNKLSKQLKKINMSWEMVNINDICRPRQWKTLSMEKLKTEGYPVYGANGKIGFYNEFSHEYPTLAITCRGATCGSVHITEPMSYINGNAMALDNISEKININFLYYYFLQRGFNDVISGSAQPQITGEGLSKIQIPLPPLHIQKQIAQILDTADALKRKDQQLLKKYDELAQAIFIDMFGDPVKNEKGWEVKKLSQVLDVDAKAVNPSTLNGYNYIGLEHIEKETGKILVIDKGEIVSNKFIFSKEHILYGKLRPYLNKVATPNFSGICSTDIFPLKPKNSLMKQFLVSILRSRDFVNHSNTNAVGANLPRANKEIILNYKTIVPDIKTAQMFSKNIDLVTAQKIKVENQILKSNSLFQTLIQKAFNNELVTE